MALAAGAWPRAPRIRTNDSSSPRKIMRACGAMLLVLALGFGGGGAQHDSSHQERRNANECPTGFWLRYECTGWSILGGGIDGSSGYQEGSTSLFNSPSGVSVSPDGSTVFVTDPGNRRIRRIDVASKAASMVSDVLQAPYAIDIFPGGESLAVSDLSTSLLHIINISTGLISSTCGQTGATALEGRCESASFAAPRGISVYRDGSGLAVADGNIIRKIDVESLSTSVLSGRAGFALDIDDTYADGLTAASRLYGPRGLDVASDGQIIVADTGNGCIRKVLEGEGGGMEASLLSGQTNCKEDGKCKGVKGPPSPWSAPVDVSATPDGRAIFVADAGTGSIRVVSVASGKEYIIAGQGTCGMVLPNDPNAEGTGLTAIAVSPAGDKIFYTIGHRVGVITLGQRGCVACTIGGCSTGEYRSECDGASFRDARCEECSTSPCESGYYRTTCDGTGSVDSQCSPCTPVSCGAGEYVSGCAASQDRSCRNCTTSGAACPKGRYRTVCDGTGATDSSCVPCTVGGCPAGEWRDASKCTSSTDAVCRPCSTIADCGPDEYARECSANADAVCAKCSIDVDCGDGKYWAACSKTADGQCVPCSIGVCPLDQYRAECTRSSDSSCSACTKGGCPAKFYRGGCETARDARCIACTVDTLTCTPELQYSRSCTANADKQCANCTLGGCGPGFYRETCPASADGRCLPCSTDACKAGLMRSTCRSNSDSLCVDHIFTLNFTVSLDIKLKDFDARRVQRNQRERNVSGHAEDDDFAQVQGRRSKQVDYVSSVSQTAGVELQHVSIFQVLEYAGQGQDSGIRVRTQISNLASDLEVKQISLELKSGKLSDALALNGMPNAKVDLQAWGDIEAGSMVPSQEELPAWVIAVSTVLGSLICMFGCITAATYKAWKYLPELFPPGIKQAWGENESQEKYKDRRNSQAPSPGSRAGTPALRVAGRQPSAADTTLVLDPPDSPNMGWVDPAAGTGLHGQTPGNSSIPSGSQSGQEGVGGMKPGCVGRAISVGVAREMESRAGPRPDMFDDNAPTAPDFRSPARLPRSSPPESGDKGGDALIDGDERTGSATTKGELTRISGHIMTEELIGESKPAASSLDIQHASRHDFSEVSTGKDPEPPVTTSRRARRIKLKPLKEPGPRNLKAAVANTEMIWPVDAHSFASAKLSSEASERRTGSDGRLPVTVRGASPLRGASPGRRAAWSMDSVK